METTPQLSHVSLLRRLASTTGNIGINAYQLVAVKVIPVVPQLINPNMIEEAIQRHFGV